MKSLLLLAIALLALPASAANKQAADSLYAHQQYAAAAQAYKALLAQTPHSPQLLYNLGNAYYKQDSIAQAILCYERAHILAPADKDIQANLNFVRTKIQDKPLPDGEFFFVTWFKQLAHLTGISQWTTIAIISFVLLLIAAAAYILLHSITLRRIGFYAAIALLILCIFANVALLIQHHERNAHTHAILMAPAVSVQSSPSKESTKLFLIHNGTKVKILDDTIDQWLEIYYEEGKQGWVPATNFEII